MLQWSVTRAQERPLTRCEYVNIKYAIITFNSRNKSTSNLRYTFGFCLSHTRFAARSSLNVAFHSLIARDICRRFFFFFLRSKNNFTKKINKNGTNLINYKMTATTKQKKTSADFFCAEQKPRLHEQKSSSCECGLVLTELESGRRASRVMNTN